MLVNSIQPAISSLPFVQDSINQVINTGESSPSITQQTGKAELTNLAQITATSHITDFTYSATYTAYAYYNDDHSLALKANSETNIKTHEETYQFDVTLSAESLGLTDEDFKDGKSKYLSFSYEKKDIAMNYLSSMQVQNTIRKPEDVLNDLAKALRQVMSDGGNKTVIYQLDDEAQKALLASPEITRLANQLILLMAYINLSKKEGPANHYAISVSGKGKPVENYQESTNIESNIKKVNFNIRINPPGASKTAETETSSSELQAALPAAGDQQTV